MDNKEAKTALERGLLYYLLQVLWQSALLTAFLELSHYLIGPKMFDVSSTLVTFVVIFVAFSFVTFFGLLMAAGRYRKRDPE